MDKLTSSKLELALVTPDAIEIWNGVIKRWHLYFTLSYLTHRPTLFVGRGEQKPEPWLMVDTRKKVIMKLPIQDEDVFNGIRDLEDRLKRIGLQLTLRYDMDKQKRKFISIRLVPTHGGAMTTVLDRIQKGTKKDYVQFALNERW